MSDTLPEPIYIGSTYKLDSGDCVVPVSFLCDVEYPLGWLCWPTDKPKYTRVRVAYKDLVNRRVI